MAYHGWGVQGWVLGVLSFWVCFRGGVGEFVVSFALGLFGWGCCVWFLDLRFAFVACFVGLVGLSVLGDLFGLCVLTRLALVCVLLVSFVAWPGIGLVVGLNVVT